MRTFKYEIPGARFQPSVRLGRWDGCVSFFSVGGATYINLLPEIVPILEEYNYSFEIEDRRPETELMSLSTISHDLFAHLSWPKNHRLEGQPIMFNDHQVEVTNSFLQNPQSMTVAATGAGKTVITAALSLRVEPYGRSLIIVPNKSLVTQTEDDYKLLGLDVGVYFGDRKEFNRKHTICTWQSLNNIIKQTKAGEAEVEIADFIDGIVCVIVDEAHAVKGDVLKSMLTGPLAGIPIRWGLTGTIPKEKFAQATLKVCLGEVSSKVSASDLQEKGHLSNCKVNVIQFVDHGEYKNYQQELSYLVTNPDRVDEIARIIAKIKETGNTLVLVDRIATGKLLHAALEDRIGKGSDTAVVFVNGSTKAADRKTEYKNIHYADGTVLIATYGVAAVGISIDRIFNLVMIEPGKSFVRVIQSIGRGLRRASDKDHVNIYDITSSLKYSKRHLTQRKQFYSEAEYPYTIEKHKWTKE